jgi:type IV pilus assembly protein PilW
MSPLAASARRQSGMSLVELMVGAVIGLIGIVIITHIYLVNEQYKRATTGSGESNVNGAIALYTIERDLRMSGFGLNHSSAFGCDCDWVTTPGCSAIRYFYNNKYSVPPNATMTNSLGALTMFPVVITDTPNQPDSISVFYGGSNERVLATTLSETMTSPGGDLKVDGTSGYAIGDLLVLVNAATAQPFTCSMTQVTAINPSSSKLEHNTSIWNPSGGGTLPSYPQGTLIFDLGRPTWRNYAVSNGRLQATDQLDVLAGGVSQDIVDDIVDLQAVYGKDTSNDGSPDVWNKVKPLTSVDWTQVIAVKFAVLARSKDFVKPSMANGACEATTTANKPTWSQGTFPTIEVAGALPSCYKYRVFETTVPLRNMIWRPE